MIDGFKITSNELFSTNYKNKFVLKLFHIK